MPRTSQLGEQTSVVRDERAEYAPAAEREMLCFHHGESLVAALVMAEAGAACLMPSLEGGAR